MRHCLALDLADDPALIERYEAWHAPGAVPLAAIASISAADIRDMQICRVGRRPFMIVETGPAFSPEAKAAADLASEDVRAWERLMWEFQRPLPDAAASEKWIEMTRVFALSDRP